MHRRVQVSAAMKARSTQHWGPRRARCFTSKPRIESEFVSYVRVRTYMYEQKTAVKKSSYHGTPVLITD